MQQSFWKNYCNSIQKILTHCSRSHPSIKKIGRADESAKFAVQARALIKSDDWYNVACLESVCGNMDAAIENLRRVAEDKEFDCAWAKRDPDLEWIRADPRFKEVVGE